MAEATIDMLVAGYMRLRERRDAIKAEYEEKLSGVTSFMEEIEKNISHMSIEQGAEGYKTKHGTVFFTMINRCNVQDWQQVLAFVKENDAYDLLTKAVKKDAVREYIEKMQRVPPGLDWATIRTFNCRKPTKD